MAMYTKCPACKSEIAFEPPKNIASLPEDYKHRIKCPSCGVTIGVRLNIIERQPVRETPLALQPIEVSSPARPSLYEPVETNTVPARSLDAPAKKKGTGRNVMMMLFSLLFVGFFVICYLVGKGTFDIEYGFDGFSLNGIAFWELLVTDFDAFKLIFSGAKILDILMTLMPMISFTLAGVTFIVAFISACCKKYDRVFNLIWSLIVFAVGALVLFAPFIVISSGEDTMSAIDYLKSIIESGQYAMFAPTVLGFLQFLFSLFFLKSLEMKPSKRD